MEDDRLAKWLAETYNSDLRKEEPDLSEVISVVDQFVIDPVDEERLFKKIEQKRKQHKPTRIRSLSWLSAAAASLVFFLAIQQLFFDQESIKTTTQDISSIVLPDESSVTLNSNSSISYQKNFGDRTLTLDGEAFFDVKKGSTFAIKTKFGTVEVLGTSFNVFARDSFLIVSCKTGKVKVSALKESKTLVPGQRTWLEAKQLFIDTISINMVQNWTGTESQFSKTSLAAVISSLSHHYGLAVDTRDIELQSLEFTGSFVHTDIEKALKMVLLPFDIKYKLDKNSLTLYQ